MLSEGTSLLTSDNLLQFINKCGLEDYAEQILDAKRAAIHIKPKRVDADSEIPIGASKLGGSPDMPRGFEWYTWQGKPLTFIAQFRLSELAPFDLAKALPPEGMLYFFYEVEEHRYDFSQRDMYKVLFHNDENLPLERLSHPVAEGKFMTIESLAACKIDFSYEATIPTNLWIDLDFHEERTYQYFDLMSEIEKASEPLHRLLGHPKEIGHDDMQLRCHSIRNGMHSIDRLNHRLPYEQIVGKYDWQLLLQIDSDPYGIGTIWGDMGCVYYWIRRQDLQAHKFDDCCALFSCY